MSLHGGFSYAHATAADVHAVTLYACVGGSRCSDGIVRGEAEGDRFGWKHHYHADVELNGWEQMKTRSSQEWGAGDRCGCGRGLRREKLPPTQQRLADALHYLGVFDGAMYPMNSVRLNVC